MSQNAQDQSINSQAKKIRAMSNEKLVYAFKAARIASKSAERGGSSAGSAELLIEALSRGECKGVAGGTVYKIACFARDRGFIK